MHGPELHKAQALGLGDKRPPEEGEGDIFPTCTQHTHDFSSGEAVGRIIWLGYLLELPDIVNKSIGHLLNLNFG